LNGRPRARDAGLRFGSGVTGPRNSIADVPGVRVGHCTISSGSGPLVQGKGPVRTGVTAILPHAGNMYARPVKGAYFDLNGCGGLVGALQIREFGLIDTPIMLTNTMSMGAVSDATVRYVLRQNPGAALADDSVIPIVSECDDSHLNDARGLHVSETHVIEAIERASQDVKEGAVGAGTGMCCYDFKGGIGTASRLVEAPGGTYALGVLVLSNHGSREELLIEGVPVGSMLRAPDPKRKEQGSIVTVIGTDAPVDARQLGRLAKRSALGLALTGSCSHNGSGDIALAFSAANVRDRPAKGTLVTETLMTDRDMDGLFRATVDATAEAIINSLFKAETTEGRDGHVVPALPIEETLDILRRHGRL
jgi:D-aminopeptidase